MHELSIVLSVIDEVSDVCEKRDLCGIETVHLRLGVFSGVDREALQYAWNVAREGTLLEHALLEIETVPLVIRCEHCARNRTPPSLYDLSCPECSSPAQTIVTGRELEVVSLEIAA